MPNPRHRSFKSRFWSKLITEQFHNSGVVLAGETHQNVSAPQHRPTSAISFA